MNTEDEMVRLRRILQDAINDLQVAMAQEESELASYYIELAIAGLREASPSSTNEMADMLDDFFGEED